MQSAFLEFSASKLIHNATRIKTCLGKLTPDQTWRRGSENENAAGNLVLHLCGNIRQWIGHGAGGKEDTRTREAEFAARGDYSAEALIQVLDEAVAEQAAVLRGLPEGDLMTIVDVQNRMGITKLEAIYQSVTHFNEHTGQIVLLTKLFTGEDLAFFNRLQPATSTGTR